MPSWTQASRKIAIATPLGDDVLILQSFKLVEEISRPFVVEAKLYSEEVDLEFEAIVGENVTIRMETDQGDTRFINGYVSRFAQGSGDSANIYYATIVPWLWFLTRSADCRIFQNKSIPEIIKEVFADFGCSEMVEDALTGDYQKLEYVVQYRETAFNFVSRLMEHEGIYYFFQHEDGKHKLVLADSPSAHTEVENYETVPCQAGDHMDLQGITEWSLEKRVMPGRHALLDFDFKVPGKDLNAEKELKAKHAFADMEVFDYPGDYIEKVQGDARAAVRIEELAMHHCIGRAKSDARGLTVGCKFTLSNPPRPDHEGDYVITSMVCEVTEDSFGQRTNIPTELFKSRFTCIPADVQIRPRRITPKPIINGPQTAIVTAPDGEEIMTDEFGRVKVKFHWDRFSASDDTSSCWIRVAQLWAGKKWGAMFIPRKDQEVIVEFLEGDPDRPIITGRVYNGECMPPYPLPESKTISTIKSNTSKGGEGFNELRFEDKQGSEQIYIHAQKDMEIEVKNDRKVKIGNDHHEIIVNDSHTEIQHNRSIKVDNDHMEEIGNDRNLKVNGKEAVKIIGSQSVQVDGDVHQEIGGDHNVQCAKQISIKADTLVIECNSNITLKVGNSYIAIDSSGINISTGDFTVETSKATKIKASMDCKIEAASAFEAKGGTVKVESDGPADFKGSVATFEGSGTCLVKGGSVMIG
jgi:type VI secretion system secreted protein VgrG